MPRNGKKTKERILDETTALVLKNGFAGTTIDHILAQTGLTKGAFFYHFKSKADLGKGIMERFANKDAQVLEDALNNAELKATSAKQKLLLFIDEFITAFADLDTPYPGCLYASYIYESEQFDQEVRNTVAQALLQWRTAIERLLNDAAAECPGHASFDPSTLADLFNVVLEGAFIVSKALDDPKLTFDQLVHYKTYLELIFAT